MEHDGLPSVQELIVSHSSGGITWTSVTASIFSDVGYGVAGNSNVGATIVDSVMTYF